MDFRERPIGELAFVLPGSVSPQHLTPKPVIEGWIRGQRLFGEFTVFRARGRCRTQAPRQDGTVVYSECEITTLTQIGLLYSVHSVPNPFSCARHAHEGEVTQLG